MITIENVFLILRPLPKGYNISEEMLREALAAAGRKSRRIEILEMFRRNNKTAAGSRDNNDNNTADGEDSSTSFLEGLGQPYSITCTSW